MPLILIVIGLVLIIYNYRLIKREDNTFEIQDKGNDFNKILEDNKNELTDYQIELGVLRKNIGESLTELQEEILELKTRLNKIEKESISYSDDIDVIDKVSLINDEYNYDENICEINFKNNIHIETSNKTDMINELLKVGLTDDEICYRLSVSKGEVLLVKELFKK